MDNLNSDMARKPDPPGGEDFVVRHFDAYLDCAGLMSTMTMMDPPPSESPSDNKRNCDSNDEDSTADLCSNDQLPMDSDTLSSDDELLMSMTFQQHSFMAKYIHEYAPMKGFLPADKHKKYFTSEEFNESFSINSHHSLESNTTQNMKHSRRGYYCCSSKSHDRIKGTECCFHLSYFWDATNTSFVFSSKGSNFPTIIDYPPN
jgi:hypothetical protein